MTFLENLKKFFGDDSPEEPKSEQFIGDPYMFVERRLDELTAQSAIKITGGKYEGIVFSVGPSVKLKETAGEYVLDYKFNVEFIPEGCPNIGSDFDKVVGDIIMDIIVKENTDSEASQD